MVRLLLLLLVVVTGSGCSGLRPDPSLPSIQAGYSSLEIHGNKDVCSSESDTLMVCNIKRGDMVRDLGIYVQGFYNGTYRAYSNNCGIDVSRTYQNSEKLYFLENVQASNTCAISVTMSPEYPQERNQDLKIESFRGYVIIRVHDGELFEGGYYKVTGDWRKTHTFKFSDSQPVRIVASGCGINYDAPHIPVDNKVEIQLKDLVLFTDSCVLHFRIIDERYEDYLASIVINQYKTRIPNNNRVFAPLPLPSVSYKSGKVRFTMPDTVSVLSLDNEYKVDYNARFGWDPTREHFFRALTVSGRITIGHYKPGVGWKWSN